MSAEFVKSVAKVKDSMAVFMRTHDLNSVFFKEERINWRAARGLAPNEENDGLVYHVLIGNSLEDPSANASSEFNEQRSFRSEREAKAFLLTYLTQVHAEFGTLRPGDQHTFNSAVWANNKRSFDDSTKKKSTEELAHYLNNPEPEILAAFNQAAAKIREEKAKCAKLPEGLLEDIVAQLKAKNLWHEPT